MRMWSTLVLGCVAGFAVHAQQDLQSNQAMALSFDAAEHALEQALEDASAGRATALRQSLSKANQAWTRTSEAYRDRGVNDSAWKTEFDSISEALSYAMAELSRGAPIAGIHTGMDEAHKRLKALRDRHGILPHQSDLQRVIEELEALREFLEDRGAHPAKGADPSERFAKTAEAWQEAKTRLHRWAAEGPSDARRGEAMVLVQRQDEAFADILAAMDSGRTVKALASIRSAERRLSQLQKLLALRPGP